MSKWIDADLAEFRMQCCGTYHGVIAFDTVKAILNDAPTIKTKEVKYFDEDEKVWKIGEVIINEQRD